MDYDKDKKKNEHDQNQEENTTKVMDEQDSQKKETSEADKIGKFDN